MDPSFAVAYLLQTFCVAFPHLSTQKSRGESRVLLGIFSSLRLGVAEGLGRHCFWQTHCLKLQEISWATGAVRHRYDFCWIYSSSEEWKLSDSGSLRAWKGRCISSSWGVCAGGNDWKPLQCCSRWAEGGIWVWAFRQRSHQKAISFSTGSHHLQKPALWHAVNPFDRLFWSEMTWSFHANVQLPIKEPRDFYPHL